MSVEYDYKMRGLLVEISEEELKDMAQEACEKHEDEDLLENRINYITYQLPVPEEKKKKQAIFWLVAMVLPCHPVRGMRCEMCPFRSRWVNRLP